VSRLVVPDLGQGGWGGGEKLKPREEEALCEIIEPRRADLLGCSLECGSNILLFGRSSHLWEMRLAGPFRGHCPSQSLNWKRKSQDGDFSRNERKMGPLLNCPSIPF
jgi:hypothetical protein